MRIPLQMTTTNGVSLFSSSVEDTPEGYFKESFLNFFWLKNHIHGNI